MNCVLSTRSLVCAIAASVPFGALSGAASAQSDFATTVFSYNPAPGQIVNNPAFSDPAQMLGPPVGGGTFSPPSTGYVSLGGFGGSITLGFDHRIMDDPQNKLGLDCIIFSNVFWLSGDPNARFAEAAHIEISIDLNNDGLPNDPWFLIPGSHIPNPASVFLTQLWDNDPVTATPPADLAWYPAGAPSPMTTAGFVLPALFDTGIVNNPNGPTATTEGVWGYAELSPTMLLGDMSGANGSAGDNSLTDPEDNPAISPASFYTVPDDPFAVGIDPTSGGGDAFDIAWAIDPVTGALANLPGFDFIRLSTGVRSVTPFGEISAELDAVADVAPTVNPADLNGDGVVNASDLAQLLSVWGTNDPAADLNNDGVVDAGDLAFLLANWS